MSTVSNKLITVALNISEWKANKKDKRITQQVAHQHGTPQEAARVYKSLLPMSSALDKVHQQSGAIRTLYYRRTVPWEYGQNVFKASAYLDFANEMRPMIAQWRQLVKEFLAVYPQQRIDAAMILNGMYDPADYPEPEEMERKFDLTLRFRPLPEAGHIVIEAAEEAQSEAAEAATRELRAELEAGIRAQYGDAMNSVWKRLYETAKHAHDRLSDPNARFHDSLIENARELVGLLPSLNIANDQTMNDLAAQLKASLCTHSPEVLRQPGVTRAETARAMADIMSKMGAFYSA